MKYFLLAIFAVAVGGILVLHHHYLDARRESRELLSENLSARAAWGNLRLRDPATGEIPRGIHRRELAFADRMTSSRFAYSNEPATIHANGWQCAGPINTGGRTRAIGIDIANEANMLIATAQGGVWRSTDSGYSWTRTTAPGQLKDMMCLTQDHRTGKTNVWYAGTGELLSTTWRRSAVTIGPNARTGDIGDGIYKSTDDGKTWSVLPATVDASVTVLDSAFDGVWNIVVDNSRTDKDIVYAAGLGAIMRSTDGGGSWSRVLGETKNISVATDIQITSKGILYAYLSEQNLGGSKPSTAGIWRSIDGIHWTNITPSTWPEQTDRMRIAIAPSDENTLYIGGLAPGIDYTPILYKYTYLSGNGTGSGGTWEDRSFNVPQTDGPVSGIGINTYVGYTLVLKVSPDNSDLVFFGGTNLFRSTDGFSTSGSIDWIGGYSPDPNQAFVYPNHHPDNHDLVFSPSNSDIAYSANDEGIFRTYSITATDDPTFPVTWQEMDNNDVACIAYVVALDHATPQDSSVLTGLQDQGSWLETPATPWTQIGGGDGCYCAIDDHANNYYVSSQDAVILQLNVQSQQSNILTEYGGMPNAQFVSPWMLDPADNSVMFLADSDQLLRNSDLATGSQSWQPIATIPGDAVISSLACDHQHRLFYGTSNGSLFRLDNAVGDATPKEITGANFPKNAFISCVAVDPNNSDSLIACFSNYHVISLFASSDGGATWRNISGNLEDNPDGSGDGPSTRWVSIVQQGNNRIYLVGTSVGLFSTTDISGSVQWQPEGLNTIGRAIVENIDARQSDGFVAVATQGSGIYTSTISSNTDAVTPVFANSTFRVSPNPASGAATVFLSTPKTETTKISMMDVRGNTVLLLHDGTVTGEAHYSFDCSRLPSGTYFVRLETEDAVETRRLIIQH